MTEPDASFTMPDMLPVVRWASNGGPRAVIRTKKARILRMEMLLSVQGDAMAVATRDRAVPLRKKAAVRRVVGGILLGPLGICRGS
jgi:hypothetical protein